MSNHFPRVGILTRISDYLAALNDNILIAGSFISKCFSDVMLSRSDHPPLISSIESLKKANLGSSKDKKIREFKHENLGRF